MITKRRQLFVVCLGVLLLILIPFLVKGIQEVIHPPMGFNPPQIGWSERVTNGQSLYPSEGSKFVEGMIAYSPIYFLIWGYLNKFTGPILNVGMGLGLVFFILDCLLIYLLALKVTKDKIISLVGPFLFLTSTAVWSWKGSPSPDSLALAFSLFGIYLVLDKKVLLSTILFSLAIYTKQSFIVGPITVSIFLLFKDRKYLLPFVGVLSTLILIPFLIVNYCTNGEFYTHVILFPPQSTQGIGMQWHSIPLIVFQVVYMDAAAILMGIVGLIYKVWKGNPFSKVWDRIGLLEIWFFTSLLVMVVIISKPGATWNYGLEWVSVSSILGCLLVKMVFERSLSKGV
jgi:hypothetical protein